jgi:hypothetical protein
VPGYIAEKYPDLAGGVGDAVERTATEVRDATSAFEFEHQSQRGRLSCAGGTEECRDTAGPGLKGQVVDSGR